MATTSNLPRIVLFLQTMTKEELRLFIPIAKASLSNRIELELFDHLLECAKESKEPDALILSKTTDKEMDKNRIFNKLVDLACDLLAAVQLSGKDFALLRDALLLHRLRVSKESLFEAMARKKWRYQEERQSDGANFFNWKLQLIDTFDFHPLDEVPDVSLDHTSETLHIQQCISQLKFMSKGMFAQGSGNLSRFETPIFEAALAYSRRPEMDCVPLVKIYRLSVDLFREFKAATYKEFQELALRLLLILNEQEKVFLFNLMINHNARAVRLNNRYIDDTLRLYRFGITHGILLEDGYINPRHFLNYIFTACAHGRTKTALQYLQNFQHYLHTKFRKVVVLISTARIQVSTQNFAAAFSIRDHKIRDIEYRILAWTIHLMAAFELEINNLPIKGACLRSRFTAYKRHLDGVKLKLGTKHIWYLSNKNFCDFLIDLYDFINNTPIISPAHKTVWNNKLDGIRQIACRTWLKEKIQQL